MDIINHLRIKLDSLSELILRRRKGIIMSLHSDSGDGYSLSLHAFNHIINAVTLRRVGLIIIIVEKQCFGICLMSIFKSLLYELVPCNLIIERLTIRNFCFRIIRHRFVHYVPGIDNILISIYNRMDMLSHSLKQYLLGNQISLFIMEHPVRSLGMPDKAMTAKSYFISTGKVGYLISALPVPLSFHRLRRLRFHIVLCSDTVKVGSNQCHLLR